MTTCHQLACNQLDIDPPQQRPSSYRRRRYLPSLDAVACLSQEGADSHEGQEGEVMVVADWVTEATEQPCPCRRPASTDCASVAAATPLWRRVLLLKGDRLAADSQPAAARRELSSPMNSKTSSPMNSKTSSPMNSKTSSPMNSKTSSTSNEDTRQRPSTRRSRAPRPQSALVGRLARQAADFGRWGRTCAGPMS